MKKQGLLKRMSVPGIVLCLLLALCGCTAPEVNGPTPASSTVAATTTTAKAEETVTVSLTVDCSNAVEQENDIAMALTKDGILFSDTAFVMPKGSTVYDALKATGLVLGAETSAYGMYVYSVQSLATGACGGQSGWLFLVNGEMTMEGCDARILQDGDVVEWVFTCNGGEDL